MLTDVLERSLVERGFGLRHVDSEVDDEHASRAPADIEAVGPRSHDIGVAAAVGVGRGQQSASCFGVDVEGAALGVAHEGEPCVLDQLTGLR
jgi:hypothetical protein